jgi:hypothetical protein
MAMDAWAGACFLDAASGVALLSVADVALIYFFPFGVVVIIGIVVAVPIVAVPRFSLCSSIFMSRLSIYGPIACYTIRDCKNKITKTKLSLAQIPKKMSLIT